MTIGIGFAAVRRADRPAPRSGRAMVPRDLAVRRRLAERDLTQCRPDRELELRPARHERQIEIAPFSRRNTTEAARSRTSARLSSARSSRRAASRERSESREPRPHRRRSEYLADRCFDECESSHELLQSRIAAYARQRLPRFRRGPAALVPLMFPAALRSTRVALGERIGVAAPHRDVARRPGTDAPDRRQIFFRGRPRRSLESSPQRDEGIPSIGRVAKPSPPSERHASMPDRRCRSECHTAPRAGPSASSPRRRSPAARRRHGPRARTDPTRPARVRRASGRTSARSDLSRARVLADRVGIGEHIEQAPHAIDDRLQRVRETRAAPTAAVRRRRRATRITPCTSPNEIVRRYSSCSTDFDSLDRARLQEREQPAVIERGAIRQADDDVAPLPATRPRRISRGAMRYVCFIAVLKRRTEPKSRGERDVGDRQ